MDCSAGLLTLRTYALYNRSKKVLASLLLLLCAAASITLVSFSSLPASSDGNLTVD